MSRAERTEAEFGLTDEERAQLVAWARGGGSARLAVRAKIVLPALTRVWCMNGSPPSWA
jgi:hypothetical protein